jgi:6-pyruvoyltetrahydropterin/6-carboxytetrahydropterin synthase
MDFGGLKAFKEWSEYMFDHTLTIAEDDPHREMFQNMARLGKQAEGGVCDIRIVEGVGCEKFAELAYKEMATILHIFKNGNTYYCPNGELHDARYPVGQGVKLRSVEVFEHAGNSATYEG